MAHEVLSVTFEIDAQEYKDARFTVPQEVCGILGLKSGDDIVLVIQHPSGGPVFSGTKELSSGTEIYGPELADHVKAGQRIRVTAYRPG